MHAVFSLFPKFLQPFDPRQLAGAVREAGLDTTNLVIRDGFWVDRRNLAATLPSFMYAMRAEGLAVRFATAGFSPAEIVAEPDLLARLAGEEIREFRMGYFDMQGPDVRANLVRARADLERMIPICEHHQIRAVYQIHHCKLISSPSAAYALVRGLPSRWIGIETDPGNQTFEGHEDFEYTARLLGEYLVAAGIKDSRLTRDAAQAGNPDKGWRRQWAPIDEGVVNWQQFIRSLHGIGFDGTFVFMPFYEQRDPAKLVAILKREVAYLRGIMKQVNQPTESNG